MVMQRRASLTADAVLMARAHAAGFEAPRLRNPDYLAASFVPRIFRPLLASALRRPFLFAYETAAPGAYALVQARTRFIDDELRRAFGEAAPPRQLLVLGAGFDTRALRFSGMTNKVFEVDHPSTSHEKQRRLRKTLGGLPMHVTYVTVDFVRESLGERLEASGFDPSVRTFVIWEGVTMYLDDVSLDSTLAFVGSLAAGSELVFDFVHPAYLQGRPGRHRHHLTWLGEPLDFALAPSELAVRLARSKLELVEQVTIGGLCDRYLGASTSDSSSPLRSAGALRGEPGALAWGEHLESASVALARVPTATD